MTPEGAWLTESQRKRLDGPLKLLAPSAAALLVAGYGAYRQFFPAFHAALIFVTAVTIGAQLFVVGQHALGAKSAVVARRPMEWLSQGIAFTFVLWFAAWIGGKYIFAWWPNGMGTGWTERYFRGFGYGGRLFLFLVVWTAIAARYFRASHAQDKSSDPKRTALVRRVAWPMLLLSVAVACAATLDWIGGTAVPFLRLEMVPLFGATFVAIGLAGALAVLLVYAVVVHRASLLPALDEQRIARWLTLAAGAALAITAVLTLVDSTWRARWVGSSWLVADVVAASLVALGALVSNIVRTPTGRIGGAVCVLLGCFLAVYVLVMPSYVASAVPHWTVPCTLFGTLLVLWVPLVQRAAKSALYPINDPNLEA